MSTSTDVPIVTVSEPTGRLRWRDGVLQQEFTEGNCCSGYLIYPQKVWRDVPNDDSAEAGR